jgi:hypothetical protein
MSSEEGAYDRYAEDMVSDDGQQSIPEGVQRRMPSVFGMLVRRILLLAVAVGIAVAICYFVYGPEWIRDTVMEYWPIALAPIIGWILGSWSAKMLYRPSGKIVISLDPETHEARVVFVPERMFRFFRQTGNNVTYHTPLFSDVYLAKSIDTDNGNIDYGWVHELNALLVFTREQSFARWNGLTEEVLMENNQLRDKPTAIALAYCRTFGKMILDDIGSAAGLFKPDYSKDKVAEGPEAPKREDGEDGKEGE